MELGMRHIAQLAVGTWQAEVLYTLAELRVVDTLLESPLTAEDVAGRLQLDTAATDALLNAAVAMRLLTRNKDHFSVTQTARRFLADDSDESLTGWVRTMGEWGRSWAQLTELVRKGGPVAVGDSGMSTDPAKLRDLEIGFYRYAVPLADELADGIDPPLVGTLVDLGGGCGAYSMALCRRHPQLQAQIFDIPDTVPIANKVISELGMADRVVAVARDYATSAYGDGLAGVLLSNMFHAETDERRRLLLERAYAALEPGGRVILNGNFLGEDRVSPPFAALHHLSSMILWEGGGDYTIGETSALLREVGFEEPTTFTIGGNVSTVLVAAKPRAS
ncbi:MAG: methyltransferase [Geodermatophilaceae bacterium]